MLTSGIGMEATGSSAVSLQLQQVTFNSVRKVLPDQVIERACRDVEYTYRRRTLTPIITILHMILAAIWPEESFRGFDGWHGKAPGYWPGVADERAVR